MFDKKILGGAFLFANKPVLAYSHSMIEMRLSFSMRRRESFLKIYCLKLQLYFHLFTSYLATFQTILDSDFQPCEINCLKIYK